MVDWGRPEVEGLEAEEPELGSAGLDTTLLYGGGGEGLAAPPVALAGLGTGSWELLVAGFPPVPLASPLLSFFMALAWSLLSPRAAMALEMVSERKASL